MALASGDIPIQSSTARRLRKATAAEVTAYCNAFVGDSGSGGTKGMVPAPASGDTALKKYLYSDGTWKSLPDFTGDQGAGCAAGLVPATVTGYATAKKYLFADGTWAAIDFVPVSDNTLTLGDATHRFSEIYLKAFTATGTQIGFGQTVAATPVSYQAGVTVTNNVASGGSSGIIANYTNLSTYSSDSNAIRNNIYQLARAVKILDDALRLYGLLT